MISSLFLGNSKIIHLCIDLNAADLGNNSTASSQASGGSSGVPSTIDVAKLLSETNELRNKNIELLTKIDTMRESSAEHLKAILAEKNRIITEMEMKMTKNSKN